MHAYVYKSLKKADTYVYLAARDDFARLPEPLRSQLGTLTFVLDVDLAPGRKLARENPDVVRGNLVDARLPPAVPADAARSDARRLGHRCLSCRRAGASGCPRAWASRWRVLAGAGGVVALVAGGLAQPAFALAVRGARQRRKRMRLRRDALALSLLWGAGLLLAALLVAWPRACAASTRRRSRTCSSPVPRSACCSSRCGAPGRCGKAPSATADACPNTGARLSALHAGAWRGLGFAALVALALVGVLLLAWPDALTANVRWIVAAAMALAWPALHWGMQGIAAAEQLPITHAFLPPDEDTEPVPASAPTATSSPASTPPRAADASIARSRCSMPAPMRMRCRRPAIATSAACRCWRRCCPTCACCAR